MNLSCDIAMDLAPIYHDGVASADTADAVRAHLKSCPDCRRFYRQYAAGRAAERRSSVASAGSGNYAALAVRINRRRAIIAAAVALYSCAVAAILIYSRLKDRDD